MGERGSSLPEGRDGEKEMNGERFSLLRKETERDGDREMPSWRERRAFRGER